MFQLLGVEVTKAQLSFDTTVISRVQKVGSIVPLETRIYALWSLNIEGGNILYNSVREVAQTQKDKCFKGLTQGKCFSKCRYLSI